MACVDLLRAIGVGIFGVAGALADLIGFRRTAQACYVLATALYLCGWAAVARRARA